MVTPYVSRLRPRTPGAIRPRRRGLFEPPSLAPVDGPWASGLGDGRPSDSASLEVELEVEAEAGTDIEVPSRQPAPSRSEGLSPSEPARAEGVVGRLEPQPQTPLTATASGAPPATGEREGRSQAAVGGDGRGRNPGADPGVGHAAGGTTTPSTASPSEVDAALRPATGAPAHRSQASRSRVRQGSAASPGRLAGPDIPESQVDPAHLGIGRAEPSDQAARALRQPLSSPSADGPPAAALEHSTGTAGAGTAGSLPSRKAGSLTTRAASLPQIAEPMWADAPAALRPAALRPAAAGPARGPTPRAAPIEVPTELTVTIGRVEVKLPAAAAAQTPPAPRSRPRRRPPSLDEYLRARAGGLAG